MRTALLIFLVLFWQSAFSEDDATGRLCIASVEVPNDQPKSLHNPTGGNPDVTYSVAVADKSPVKMSRESGEWLEGLALNTKLPVVIFEDGERAASFYVEFGDDGASKCLFLKSLYLTWQVWDWDKTGPWCDCSKEGETE